jgi:hypothetical protein
MQIYADPFENDEDVIFECEETLSEKRKRMTLNIPTEEPPRKLVIDVNDLRSLLSTYPDNLAIAGDHDKVPADSWTMSGREVGDDRVDFSNSHEQSALALTVQEGIMGMRTSKEDTGITTDLWNFCEVTTGLPSSRGTMYSHARKNDNFKDLDFVDSPPLRTVIDTAKVDRIHSTSYIGKSKILGAKRRSSNAVCSSYLSVANTFQDACLAVWKAPEPKYLPSALGGCHCPDAYNDPVNTYLFMKAFHGGGYDRLYGTAVEEIREAIRLNENGQATPCIIAEVLRDDDTYCFATFANFVAVPDVDKFHVSENALPPPLYERAGVKNEVTSTECRLIQAKRLVPKTQARVEFEKTSRLKNYIFSSVDITADKRSLRDQSLRRRAQISGALRGNTAYMNLVRRTGTQEDITHLFKEGWRPCVNGQPEFNLEHARWLSRGGKGEYLTMHDIPSTQDMFVRAEVSSEESMKVSGITLAVQGSKSFMVQRTISKVGLYEISSSMEQWCDDKMSALIEKRDQKGSPLERAEILPIFEKNREWINDDSTLIEQCIEDTKHLAPGTQVALVTQDKRLAKQMARQANVIVVRIEPESACIAFPNVHWNSTTALNRSEVLRAYPPPRKRGFKFQVPSQVYLDTGSILASLSKMVKEEKPDDTTRFYRVDLISSGRDSDGRRIEEYRKKNVYGTSILMVEVINPAKRNILVKKPTAHARDAGSFLSDGWNVSDTTSFTRRVTSRKGVGGATTRSNPT